MSWLPVRRDPPGPRPCLGTALLRELLADERSAGLLVTTVPREVAAPEASSQGRLSDREWFGFHVVAFCIGAWNLFAIDFARGSQEWWFWMPVAAWATAVGLHGAWLLAGRRIRVSSAPVLRRLGAGR